LKSNFPTASVYDIKFIKKTHDLVVATHGRGLFVMDEITPLEETGGGVELAKSEFRTFPMAPAVNWHFWNKHGFASGGYSAPNPMTGAVITYYLPNEIKVNPEQRRRPGGEGPVKITIADSTGQVIRTMYGPSKFGVNRAAWNMRYDGPKRLNFLPPREGDPEEEFFFDPSTGPTALPGTYKVSVTVNGKTETQTVEVQTDPRFKFDEGAMRAQLKLGLELRDEVSALNEALNRLASLHKQIGSLQEMLHQEGEDGASNVAYKPVLEEARALDKKITEMQASLYNTEVQPGGQDDIHYLQKFHDRLQGAMRGVMGGFGEAPKVIQVEEAAEVRKLLEDHLQKFNALLNTDVVAFNKKASEHGSSTLFAGGPVQIKPAAGAASSAGSGDKDEDDQDQE
jgi:DNA-binding protein YbaB